MRPKLTNRKNEEGELIYTYMCSTKERSHGTVCSMKNCNGNTLDAKIIEEIRKLSADKETLAKLLAQTKKYDVIITEIGGTVGDIESQPFLEAIRQVAAERGRENVLFIHVPLIVTIPGSGELKSKPTQHSVQKLREEGVYPDLLLCRAERMIPEGERAKISLFSNVPMDCVISVADASTIYEVPLMLHAQGLDDIVCRKLGLETKPADLSAWENIVYRLKHPKRQVTVGMVGKYVDYADSYKSLNEALTHAGIHTETKVVTKFIDASEIEEKGTGVLEGLDAILVPGGFGKRGKFSQ